MVIWLYCIFSNEERLLPFFMRHYAPWVDRLFLFDNCSTDNSRAIIGRHSNVSLERYPAERAEMDSVQAALFASEHYREARGFADWVLWVDCDEFLHAGQVKMRDLLRIYQKQNLRAIRAQGYQMVSDHFPAEDAPLVEQVTTGLRDKEYDKLCAFDPMLNITFTPGRHNFRIASGAAHQGEVKLLHYRFLGEAFFKQRNAYLFANRSEAERAANRTYHAAPDHDGKYSLAWFRQAQAYAADVVSNNLVEVTHE